MSASNDEIVARAASMFGAVSAALQAAREPHGPDCQGDTRKLAGQACVDLCQGDQNKARTLWKSISNDLGGYVPHAAAVALIRGANTINLVPDIEAPPVS